MIASGRLGCALLLGLWLARGLHVVPSASIHQANDYGSIRLDPPKMTACKDRDIDVLFVSPGSNLLKAGEGMVAKAEEAFRKSGLTIALKAHYRQIEGKTSGSALADVNDLAAGRFAAVFNLREQTSADVVALIGNTYTDCGAARQIAADAQQAFITVSSVCESRGPLAFAHELGHLAGAVHNGENAQVPFSYARGHVESGGTWGTIMGVGACDGCTLARWSNPKASHNGKRLGRPNYSDNVRLWRNRARVVAGFVCRLG